MTEADVRTLGAIHAVEIYNGTAIDHNDKADSWYVLDLLLRRGGRYAACATDDAHFNPERRDALRGWVHAKSETLEPEALLTALKSGDYYSSTGPRIEDIELTPGETLAVRCSPADRIFFTGHGSLSYAVHGEGITEAEFSLKPFASSGCFRVTVRDAQGGRLVKPDLDLAHGASITSFFDNPECCSIRWTIASRWKCFAQPSRRRLIRRVFRTQVSARRRERAGRVSISSRCAASWSRVVFHSP